MNGASTWDAAGFFSTSAETMMDPIERYKAAYRLAHQREIEVLKRGSWLILGNHTFAPKVRKSELDALTNQLLYRVWKKSNP